MAGSEGGAWLDHDAGRLVRPYTVSAGRTSPTNELDLVSMVRSTGRVRQAQLAPEHAQALGLCQDPTSVAEVAARLHLPAVVTKILLSDLVDCGAVTTRPSAAMASPTDINVLEAVLDGLRKRL
ncbi:putative transcriptional regulator [Lipingzhangella halophila]|uniref:Putative transcriptional regulator n=1 Tax=Lipingzhangella halophila TaxID=1783352 RepID=A0A7W7RM61_9ACTN|nr:DUF742 domain-containing protein [Lipingzhangella halophila]MBB4934534.1 putative transcriptional regulator [Lipingzhangella halophila]